MASVNLHAIEAGFLRPARALRKLIHRQIDVRLFDDPDFGRLHPGHPGQLFHQEEMGEIPPGLRRKGRRPQGMAPALTAVAGHQPAMVQLRRDLSTSGVHPIAQYIQPRNEPVVRDGRLLHGNGAHRPGNTGHA